MNHFNTPLFQTFFRLSNKIWMYFLRWSTHHRMDSSLVMVQITPTRLIWSCPGIARCQPALTSVSKRIKVHCSNIRQLGKLAGRLDVFAVIWGPGPRWLCGLWCRPITGTRPRPKFQTLSFWKSPGTERKPSWCRLRWAVLSKQRRLPEPQLGAVFNTFVDKVVRVIYGDLFPFALSTNSLLLPTFCSPVEVAMKSRAAVIAQTRRG
jgi:hypothetical protein